MDLTPWLNGLLVGLVLGIPTGLALAVVLSPLDRWIDDHWER